MDKENKSLIERAITLFNKGRFAEAKTLYEKADEIYGNSLFRINIELCDKRISKSEYFSQARQEILNIAESINSSRLTSRERISTQLAETQGLLENYYSEYQRLLNKEIIKSNRVGIL